MINETHLKQLEDRGINEEIASRLGWSSSSDGFLAIPYFRNGIKVGTKYRTIKKDKFYQDEGSEQCLYNLDIIKDIGTAPLLITEGEFDCAVALQCGYVAVSVPNGAPAKIIEDKTTTKYDFLKDIPPDTQIIICADSDEAGANLLHDLTVRLKAVRCKWVTYPKGCKDLNDALVKYGSKGVEETIRRAQWCKIDGNYSLSELPPMPTASALACPISGLGNNYKIRPGDFTVITGSSGYGKTTFVNDLACGMVTSYGWHVAIASFEQNPQLDHLRALRTYYSKKPAALLTDKEKIEADEWVENNFTFLVPNIDDEVTLKWVVDHMEAAIIRRGAKLLIIDPWNELDHTYPREMMLTTYIGFAIKQFKRLARKYMVHVILVAHPSKPQKLKDGTYPTPTLYDISDSANFKNKCDVGIVVHRNPDKTTLIKVEKVRYWGVIGKPDDITLQYDDYLGRYVLPDETTNLKLAKNGKKT